MAAANPQRGEIGFEVGGKQHVLKFSTNALCALEEEFNLEDVSQIGAMLGEKPSIRTLRKLFRIGLSDSEPDLTDAEAGGYMDAAGSITEAAALLTRAIQAAFPTEEGGSSTEDPPKKGGTGARSR